MNRSRRTGSEVEQRLVEEERRALAPAAEHLTQREPEQQRDLVAGAVRHRVERHHVGPLAAEQAQREVVGVDVDIDVARAGQQAEPVAERVGEARCELAMRDARRRLDQVGCAGEAP